MKVTIYGLCASDDGRIRYVGQTSKSFAFRMKYHLVGAKRWPQRRISKWITSVLNRGAEVRIFEIQRDAVENEAEIRLIKWYRDHGAILVNGTNGGEGCSGYKPSMATRERIRAIRTGSKQSSETKRRRSVSLTGRKLSAEHIAKISAAHMGKKEQWFSELNKDPAFREKARLARMARWAKTPKKGPSLEARKKMSEAKKGQKRNKGLEMFWMDKKKASEMIEIRNTAIRAAYAAKRANRVVY